MRAMIRFSVLWLLLGGGAFMDAQTVSRYNSPIGSLSSAKGESFSSLEGRYKIALPKRIGGFSRGTFQWRLPEGYFTVGYQDSELDVETSRDAEDRALSQAQVAITGFNYWLLENPVPPAHLTQKTVRLDGHLGIELRAEMPNGLGIARCFVVKKRIYSLAVMLVGEQRKNEAVAMGVFDSFQVTPDEDADASLRQRIAEATPRPLPQEPVALKLKSDAEDENLKGRVKAVVEEIEGLSGTMLGRKRRPSSEAQYNEKGNLIKEVSYNDAGLTRHITVYGYIDGIRVSTSGFVSFESDPPPMIAPGRPGRQKPRDSRYGTRHAYKYGEDGKLSETLMYGNDGALLGRTVYKRSGNQLERLLYSENGSLNSRGLAALDKNGNETEQTYFGAPLKGWDQIYRYTYEFDDRGNWIKRVATFMRAFRGLTSLDSSYITYRTISYY